MGIIFLLHSTVQDYFIYPSSRPLLLRQSSHPSDRKGDEEQRRWAVRSCSPVAKFIYNYSSLRNENFSKRTRAIWGHLSHLVYLLPCCGETCLASANLPTREDTSRGFNDVRSRFTGRLPDPSLPHSHSSFLGSSSHSTPRIQLSKKETLLKPSFLLARQSPCTPRAESQWLGQHVRCRTHTSSLF